MAEFLLIESAIIVLLILVSAVAMLAQRIRLPYTVVLVLVGLSLSFLPFEDLSLLPELILLIFLPPLVFEAALHIEVATFRRLLPSVLVLAIPGVLIVTLIVGSVLGQFTAIRPELALLFGALIAATDPVAVVSLFKSLGAPKSLATLVEGESLLNDGTTIVIFTIIAFLLFPEQNRHSPLLEILFHDLHLNNVLASILAFLGVAAGGVLIGSIVGVLGNYLFALIDDHLIETTLSTIIAYGTYLAAEALGLSGVLAVVAAGIIVGMSSTGNMSPTTRNVLMNFWEYLAFLANSVVFILIGMRVHVEDMISDVWPIAVAVFAVLLARAISVYGLAALYRLIGGRVRANYLHVMFWGGLRGAVSLALVLSLSADAFGRAYPGEGETIYQQLLNITFGVVLFTLLVQATTINGLLARLGLVERVPEELRYEQIQGRLLATRTAYQRLDRQYENGVLDPQAWSVVRGELQARKDALQEELEAYAREHPEVATRVVEITRREALRTQRAAVQTLQREGVLSDGVSQDLIEEIDDELDSIRGPAGEEEGAAASA